MKVVFGGSFNPPTIAHEKIIELLSKRYDEVIIVPNGSCLLYTSDAADD